MTERLIAPTSRGILDPAEHARHVRLQRFEVPELFDGLLEWVWSVDFDLPAGRTHRSEVLSLPAVNISVGNTAPEGHAPPPGPYPTSARVVGLARRVSVRVLSGQGWNVAAKTTVGGFGGFVPTTVSRYTDRTVPMADVLPLDAAALTAAMDAADDAGERARILLGVLEPVVERIDPARREAAREVADIARVAEQEAGVRRTADLARRCGVSHRTLQRLFAEHIGTSPSWVIRRFRLTEAADRVASGEPVRWAEVAADLGYADQAHLSRDFSAAIGCSPSTYAERQRVASDASPYPPTASTTARSGSDFPPPRRLEQ